MVRRPAIPTKVRQLVLSEFNYRCAVCGTDRPHLHHIDENPQNNDPLNIIPLCPNCHLVDQHNPTSPVDPRKIKMFRFYKDPAILKPQFHPLFSRMLFLDSIADDQDAKEVQRQAQELIDFVASLEMGQFYGKQIERLLRRPRYVYLSNGDPAAYLVHQQEYRMKVRASRDQVHALVVEQLRYQNW